MNEYPKESFEVASYEVIGVRCTLCPPNFIVDDREPTHMTMEELDTVCRLHWAEHHGPREPVVIPM